MAGRRRSGKPCCLAAVAGACLLTVLAAAAGGQAAVRVPLSELSQGALPAGTCISTEGIYSGRIEDSVVLDGSSTLFVLGDNVLDAFRAARIDAKTMVVFEGITAYREDTRTYYVKVTGFELAGDAVGRVLAAIDEAGATSESLIATGKWARELAARYRDARLASLADAAFQKALRLEELAVARGDYEAYFRIGGKARELLNRPALSENYIRKGLDAFVVSAGSEKAETYYEAARMAERLLPDSPAAEQMLVKGFAIESGRMAGKDAEEYYRLAAKANEIFGGGAHYVRLLGKALEAERSKIDGRDYQALYALARKVREIYPESADYRGIVISALAAEKSAMNANDAGAWVRLGNRILYFLSDRYQAGLCFKQAVQLDPSDADTRAKLREMGYVYYQGNWWRSEEFGRSDMFRRAKELEDLAAAGQVALGMTRSQVVRAKGMPQETAMSGGGWGVTTQWIYRNGDRKMYVTIMADTVVSKGESSN